MIGLISLDRKCAGVTDYRTSRDSMRVLKTNDGRIVTGGNVDQGVSQSQPVPELTYKLRTENVGPVQPIILLFVVLISTFAENNVIRLKDLSRILPSAENSIFLGNVPIESRRIIVCRKAERLSSNVCPRRTGIIRNKVRRKTIKNRLYERPIGRIIIRGRRKEPVCRIPFKRQWKVSCEGVGT